MNLPTCKSVQHNHHHQLYPNQWIISKLSWVPLGWNIYLTILLTFHLAPLTVFSQHDGYIYRHPAYRQSLLPGLRRNQEVQPVMVEPSVDDLTVDDNYETKVFKFRSSDNGDGGNIISQQGINKDNGGYTFGLDSSSKKAGDNINNLNNNENIQRLHNQQPQQPKVDNQNGNADLSSFIQDIPRPSSQLKASNFHVDSFQPVKMYARASSSARIHTNSDDSAENLFFVGSVIGVTFVGIFVVIATGYFVHRINVQRKAAADVEYPAYGVVGPGASLKEKEALSSTVKSTSGTSKGSGSGNFGGSGSLSPIGDRRLAQSAQIYHYHHQKQQMISSDKLATETGQHPSTSEVDSEEENEEGDYTVYECPGLASTGEMEVKNPLFQDDITPISSPSVGNTKQNGSSN